MIDSELLKKVVKKVSAQFHFNLVVLFGSQVDGNTHAQSDIDIGVMSDHVLRPKELAQIGFELSQAAKLSNVEVSDLKMLPPLVLKSIAEQSVLLYESAINLYDRFVIYGLKRHMEAAPLYRARALELKKFLATNDQ